MNRRSLTAQSDRIAAPDLRSRRRSVRRPRCGIASRTGHTYRWHEHRLHALEPLAAGRGSEADLGRWSVPMLIDGRRHALIGTLRYRPPGATWAWIAAACGIAILTCALVAVARPAWQRATVGTAVAAVLLTGTIRIARELYGRPDVTTSNYLAIVFTTVVGLTLLLALLRGRGGVPLFTACLVGIGSLFQGIALFADGHARVCADRALDHGRARRGDRDPRARRRPARGDALGPVPAGTGGGRMNGQTLRLLVAVLALAAGIVAVVVMIVLLGRTPGPV